MGRGHGNTHGSSSYSPTERGMSRSLQKAVLSKEESIRNNPSESLHVFDDQGNETYTARANPRTPYQVAYDTREIKDKVMTHNHPRSLGKSGYYSVGNSFSPQDMIGAVHGDAREQRAVTPKYTFSMKRPASGWGATPLEVKARYTSVIRSINRKDKQYLSSYKGDRTQAAGRLSATYWHRVNKAVAKSFGWEYTKRKK